MRRARASMLAALTLAGCATAPRAPHGTLADPAELRDWTATGRMAIAAGEDGGSGSFSWTQRDATTRLDLRGPLGAGGVRLVVAPGSMSLADAGGRELDAEAARADLEARLGADLPWHYLRYWMLGVPAPGTDASVSTHDDAPVRIIEQSGWRVGYDEFQAVQGLWLPVRLTAATAGARLKLVVSEWRFPGGAGPAATRQP